MPIEGKRILVTGGAGFIGSEVVRLLLNRYEDVTVKVLDDFSFGGNFNLSGPLQSEERRLRVIEGDMRNKDLTEWAVKDVDIVIHLAARPFIPECYKHPEETFSVNAIGTLNLLLSSIRSKVERFVHVSTSEVYGTAMYVPMDEAHPTHPQSTYSASKLAAENLAFTLYKEQNLPVVILRPFNTYGPQDSHPRIIPEIISQLSKGNVLRLGNISATRDFTYVSDVAHGIIQAAVCDKVIGEIINLGSEVETPIKKLVDLISDIMRTHCGEVVLDERKLRPYDVKRLCTRTDKARHLLEWKTTTPLNVGLKKTVEWYLKHGAKWRWEMGDYPTPYAHALTLKDKEMWRRPRRSWLKNGRSEKKYLEG